MSRGGDGRRLRAGRGVALAGDVDEQQRRAVRELEREPRPAALLVFAAGVRPRDELGRMQAFLGLGG